MTIIGILIALTIGQLSSPSDECDACRMDCENQYAKTGKLVQDSIIIDTTYPSRKNSGFLREESRRKYIRNECDLAASVDPFHGATWEISTNMPLRGHKQDTRNINNIFVGIKCDTVSRVFSSYKRFKRLPTSGTQFPWENFTWKKWKRLNPNHGARTCECDFVSDIFGKTRVDYTCALSPIKSSSIDVIPLEFTENELKGKLFSNKGSFSVLYKNKRVGRDVFEYSVLVDFIKSKYEIYLGSDSLYRVSRQADTVTIRRIEYNVDGSLKSPLSRVPHGN